MTDMYIAVVGGGEVDDDLVAFGRAVGQGLAEAGVVVVCGGLGDILGAVLRGVPHVGTPAAGVRRVPGPGGADDHGRRRH